MRNAALAIILLIPTLAFADTILFGDSKNGAKLHQNSCTACHDSKVYTRNDRIIGTLGGLEGRVEMCSTNLNTSITDC